VQGSWKEEEHRQTDTSGPLLLFFCLFIFYFLPTFGFRSLMPLHVSILALLGAGMFAVVCGWNLIAGSVWFLVHSWAG
jgi:hypothetical protein